MRWLTLVILAACSRPPAAAPRPAPAAEPAPTLPATALRPDDPGFCAEQCTLHRMCWDQVNPGLEPRRVCSNECEAMTPAEREPWGARVINAFETDRCASLFEN